MAHSDENTWKNSFKEATLERFDDCINGTSVHEIFLKLIRKVIGEDGNIYGAMMKYTLPDGSKNFMIEHSYTSTEISDVCDGRDIFVRNILDMYSNNNLRNEINRLMTISIPWADNVTVLFSNNGFKNTLKVYIQVRYNPNIETESCH